MVIKTELADFVIRKAVPEDVGLILSFIKELAIYEKMLDEVVATEESLMESIFVENRAEVLIGEYKKQPVAFALFFHNFSTFRGRPGIYLEDIYVKPNMRGIGIGSVILSYLAKIAVERRCSRMEWSCLDWNQPSIDFYHKMGATPMDEWTVYRLHANSLTELAAKFEQDTK